VDKSTKLKLKCNNSNHRHQCLNHKHQLKQGVHLMAEVVPLVEAEVEVVVVVLHNLLKEKQTLLNNNWHWQHMYPLMEH
jgi:hypothetical protein